MTKRPPTPTGWSDTDWVKKLQDDEENPLGCLHINQGSFDAAADAYEEEYKMSKRTALDIADQVDAYVVRTSIGAEAAAMLRQQHAEIDRLKRERHHIYDLLARIHRDGGQYTAEQGVEKSCDDAEAQVVTWLDTISGVDALIEQARIADRAACAATAPDLLWALETIIDASPEPPEANCSCHICPPCRDCVDYEELREAYRYVRAAIRARSAT